MHTVLKNRLARWAAKSLRVIPYFDKKIERSFQAEQQEVIKMLEILADQLIANPKNFLRRMEGPTNNIKFREDEIQYIRNGIERLNRESKITSS